MGHCAQRVTTGSQLSSKEVTEVGSTFGVDPFRRHSVGARDLEAPPEVLGVAFFIADGSDLCFENEHRERIG